MNVKNLIQEVGEEESKITEQEFVSPIFYNEFVATKIFGIVYTFKITENKPGWYKVKPIDYKNAKTISTAQLPEIFDYLNQFKKIRLTLVFRKKNVYFALPDKANHLRLPFDQLIPLYLFDDFVLDFDKVVARFDGANFWFHETSPSSDPAKTAYLRDMIQKSTPPKKLNFAGITIEDKIAYHLSYAFNKKNVEDTKKDSLRKDVEHAGGEFIDFVEKQDHYKVTYKVDGHQYSSTISKNTSHSVITAGVCLSGGDKTYDLKSLITVMREGQNRNKIYRTNNV